MKTRVSLIATVATAAALLLISAAHATPGGMNGVNVVRVTASSTHLDPLLGDLSPASLVDRDPDTWWQPGGRSPRFAWVRFDLAQPARIDSLVISNGILAGRRAVGSGLSEIGRLRSAWVLMDDGDAEVIRLDPQRTDPRRVILARLHTTRSVTLVIRDVERGERWNHVGLSEVVISGRPTLGGSPAPPSAVDHAYCGSQQWRPIRDAVVAHCGDPSTSRTCVDPMLDVILRCRADRDRPLPPIEYPPRRAGATASWSYRGRWFSVNLEVEADRSGRWRVSELELVGHGSAPASP